MALGVSFDAVSENREKHKNNNANAFGYTRIYTHKDISYIYMHMLCRSEFSTANCRAISNHDSFVCWMPSGTLHVDNWDIVYSLTFFIYFSISHTLVLLDLNIKTYLSISYMTRRKEFKWIIISINFLVEHLHSSCILKKKKKQRKDILVICHFVCSRTLNNNQSKRYFHIKWAKKKHFYYSNMHIEQNKYGTSRSSLTQDA